MMIRNDDADGGHDDDDDVPQRHSSKVYIEYTVQTSRR